MNINNQLLVFKGNENLFSKDKIVSEDFGIVVLQFDDEIEKQWAILVLEENNIKYFENEELAAQAENENSLFEGNLRFFEENLLDESEFENYHKNVKQEENMETEKEIKDPLREGPIAAYPVKVYYDMTDVRYKDVVVAILDTGFTLYNEKYRDRVLPSQFNFTSSPTVEDLNEHGTQVASIILESTYDEVKILPIKILEDKNAQGSLFSLYQGIMCAIEQEVDIINISAVSKSKNSSLIDMAIEKAKEKGIIIVVAAGNNGEDIVDYTPANNKYCITIGAIDNKMRLSNFSNYGDTVDYYAFGDNIPTYNSLGEKTSMNGTSASAASVTALIASLESCAIEYDLDDLTNISEDEDEKLVLNIFNFFEPSEDNDEDMIPIKDYDEIVYSAATQVNNVANNFWNIGGYLVKSGSSSAHASISITEPGYIGAFWIQGDGVDSVWSATGGYPDGFQLITPTRSTIGTRNVKLSARTTATDSTTYTMHNAKTSVVGGYYSSGSGTAASPYVCGGRVQLREGSSRYWATSGDSLISAVGGHSLTFYANGGEGYMAPIYRFNRSIQYLPPVAYSRQGYHFLAWCGLNTIGQDYTIYVNQNMFPAGGVASTDCVGFNADTAEGHLYAVWYPNRTHIVYNMNGGSFEGGYNQQLYDGVHWHLTNPTSVLYSGWRSYYLDDGTISGASNYDDNNNLRDEYYRILDPVRTGYTFTGWRVTGLDNCAHSYYNGAEWVTTYDSAINVRLYFSHLRADDGQTAYFTANWSPNSYNIKYNLDGGSMSTTPPATVNYDQTFTVVNPTKAGYDFAGWTITNTSSGTLINQKGTNYSNLRNDIGQTVTFTAVWSKEQNVTRPYIWTSGGWKAAVPYTRNDSSWKCSTQNIYIGSKWE